MISKQRSVLGVDRSVGGGFDERDTRLDGEGLRLGFAGLRIFRRSGDQQTPAGLDGAHGIVDFSRPSALFNNDTLPVPLWLAMPNRAR
jgi:hypothetical protein